MTAEEQVAILREVLEQIAAKTFDPWARAIAEGAVALDAITAQARRASRSMTLYYDRQGQPLEEDAAMRWFEHGDRIVKQTRHKEHGRELWLSTVHLVIDHNYGEGPPLIFETMLFEIRAPSWSAVIGERVLDELACDRYASEEAARDGHKITRFA